MLGVVFQNITAARTPLGLGCHLDRLERVREFVGDRGFGVEGDAASCEDSWNFSVFTSWEICRNRAFLEITTPSSSKLWTVNVVLCGFGCFRILWQALGTPCEKIRQNIHVGLV